MCRPKFHRRTDGHAGRLQGERSFSTDSAVQLYMQTAKVFILLRNLYCYQVWKKKLGVNEVIDLRLSPRWCLSTLGAA